LLTKIPEGVCTVVVAEPCEGALLDPVVELFDGLGEGLVPELVELPITDCFEAALTGILVSE
jgi:hypothetical protein